METLLYAAPVAGILALVVAFGLSSWIKKQDEGTDRMKEIATYIREGAMAFQMCIRDRLCILPEGERRRW